MKKTREDVTKEILDVDFDDTTKAKIFDDDGYEEGKSKDREMKMAEISNKDKLSDYTKKVLHIKERQKIIRVLLH